MADNDTNLDVTYFSPCEVLRPYIRYYYVLKCINSFSSLTFPLGCPQILFHRCNPLYIPELDKTQAQFTISGQVNFPSHVATDGNTDMIAIVFYPHTIGPFIAASASLLYNQEISGFDIGNRAINRLALSVLDCDDTALCIKRIENYLISRLDSTLPVDLVKTGICVKNLMQSPGMTVKTLATKACLSERQFVRVFHRYVGMNPKEYAAIVRFQKTLWMLQNGNRNFADIAYACDYSDQSHFIRHFRKYSGKTPAQFLALQPVYSDLFNNPV